MTPLKNFISLKSFMLWLHVESCAHKLLSKLCDDFPTGIEVLEHYGDYFRIRLDRQKGDTIGHLFGIVEDCKEKMGLISEYSVSQTTLEQIFQTFAKEGGTEDDELRKEMGEEEVQIKTKVVTKYVKVDGHLIRY